MSFRLPLLLPNKFTKLLSAWRQNGVPHIAVASIAQYLWSSEVVCVASRDGYLRLLFNDMSFVFEKHVGPEAVWCLCAGWDHLYVSLFGRGLEALAFEDRLPLRHRLSCNFTFLCVCCTTRNVCAGSDHGTFYICAPNLVTLQIICIGWHLNRGREVNCCVPLRDGLLVGTEHGELLQALDLPAHSFAPPAQAHVVKFYPTSEIFSLCFSQKHGLIFVGLDHGVDAICPVTYDSIFLIPTVTSVWSLAVQAGSDVIMLGTQLDGVMVYLLTKPDLFEYSITSLEYRPGIGTCSAIRYASDGSWYAASNRSLLFHVSTLGVLYARSIAGAVLEADDPSGIPRLDIYDVCIVWVGGPRL